MLFTLFSISYISDYLRAVHGQFRVPDHWQFSPLEVGEIIQNSKKNNERKFNFINIVKQKVVIEVFRDAES